MGIRGAAKYWLVALSFLTPLPAFSDDVHESTSSGTSISSTGSRPATGDACRTPCPACMEKCMQCSNGCCSLCVSQEKMTQNQAVAFCESVQGRPARPAEIQQFADSVGLKSASWSALQQEEVIVRPRYLLNFFTLGAAGPSVRVRTFGQAVFPNGNVRPKCQHCRYLAACVMPSPSNSDDSAGPKQSPR